MELAKAYVQIIPTTEGIKNNLVDALGGDAAKDAGASTGATWSSAFSAAFSNPILQVAKTAFEVVAAGAIAAGGAYAGMLTSSIKNYSEYEQLVGGSELMFGKAYDFIAEKASTAYKDVQISQSEYLKQVNGFAVGLKTAMDGDEQAAAELADRIIRAEADVVAATGKDRESVENAFNGIMRNNFTMLDNLGLGINATKEGMQAVIDEVNEWNAQNGKVTNYAIDNIADVQSALVDYVEKQGMANYAAMEGSTTIQGSFASLKAAFSDLMTGLSDESANIPQLTGQVVTQVFGVVDLLLPRINQFGIGLSNAFVELAKGIAARLPDIIDGFQGFMDTLYENIPVIFENIGKAMPYMVEIGMTLIEMVIQGMVASQSAGGEAVLSIIAGITETLDEQWDNILLLGGILVTNLLEGISSMRETIIPKARELIDTILDSIGEMLPDMLDMGVQLTSELVAGISTHFAEWLANGGVTDLIEGFNTIWNAFDWGALGSTVVDLIISSISSGAGRIWETIKDAVLGNSTAASAITSTANATKNVIAKASEVSVNISGNVKKFLNASTTTTQRRNAAYGYAVR